MVMVKRFTQCNDWIRIPLTRVIYYGFLFLTQLKLMSIYCGDEKSRCQGTDVLWFLFKISIMFDQICWRRKSHTNNFFVFCLLGLASRPSHIIITLPGKIQPSTSRSQWHSKHLNCQTKAITSYNTTSSKPPPPTTTTTPTTS